MAISHIEQYRKPARKGVDITFKLVDEATGEVFHKTFYFDTPSPPTIDITSRLNSSKTRLEFKLNKFNDIRIEDIPIRAILKDIVQYIRANVGCTVNDIITLIDTNYPDLIWKPIQLLKRLQEELDRDITFTQFKTFCINKKFGGIDG